MFSHLFRNTVYIKIRANRFDLRHIEADQSISVVATEQFTTARLLIGQFSNAETLLRDALQQLLQPHWILIRPLVVLHPLAMTEGGLSQIEERALMELSASAGARKTRLWLGPELSDQKVLTKAKEIQQAV